MKPESRRIDGTNAICLRTRLPIQVFRAAKSFRNLADSCDIHAILFAAFRVRHAQTLNAAAVMEYAPSSAVIP